MKKHILFIFTALFSSFSIAQNITNNGAIISLNSDAVLKVNGDFTNKNSGEVMGEGTVEATGAILNEAIWTPGFSPGTLTVNGNADYSNAASTYNVELASLSSFDQTIVNGDLALGGTLNVSLLGGFVPGTMDEYIIMTTSGNITGTFATVNLPSPEMDNFYVYYSPSGAVMIRPNSALPVELVEFHAQAINNNSVECTWRTESETNNSHFEIERSQDGQFFETIGSVQGSGTSSVPQEYSFVDDQPFLGVSYYRLKQVDFDEAFEYSEVRSVYLNTTEGISLYPNPVQDALTIQSSQKINQVRIFNTHGQTVLSRENETQIDVSGLSAGNYIIEMITPLKTTQQTFIKQ